MSKPISLTILVILLVPLLLPICVLSIGILPIVYYSSLGIDYGDMYHGPWATQFEASVFRSGGSPSWEFNSDGFTIDSIPGPEGREQRTISLRLDNSKPVPWLNSQLNTYFWYGWNFGWPGYSRYDFGGQFQFANPFLYRLTFNLWDLECDLGSLTHICFIHHWDF